MAGTKNATAVKGTAKQVKEYKVIGKRFKNKTGAREELEEVFKKGFKSAGFYCAGYSRGHPETLCGRRGGAFEYHCL